MTGRPLLLLLLFLCSLGSIQGCKQELQVNVKFEGKFLEDVYSPDARHCQQMCTQDPYCNFFTFYEPDYEGTTKGKYVCSFMRKYFSWYTSTFGGEPTKKTTLKGVTSGYSLKTCTERPEYCSEQIYPGVMFTGGEYRFLFVKDYKECQRACTHDDTCQYFTWKDEDFPTKTERYECALRFSGSVVRTSNVAQIPKQVSGFSRRAEISTSHTFLTECENEFFKDTVISGGIGMDKVTTGTPEHCHVLCAANPLCTHFIYNEFQCKLLTGLDKFVTSEQKGVTSGLPTRHCQQDRRWLTVPQHDVGFRGSDIIFNKNVPDLETCIKMCDDNPNCQFYTFVGPTFHNSNYRRMCVFKRVIVMPAPKTVVPMSHVTSGFALRMP